MKRLLYPARQRCRTCRQFLTVLAVKGEYCCYICAGVPDPERVPYAEWPRKHVLGGTCFPPKSKRYYMHEAEAREAARLNRCPDAYQCDFCWHWHIGTSRSEKK